MDKVRLLLLLVVVVVVVVLLVANALPLCLSALAVGDDDLDGTHGNGGGNHANTHIPEIIGSARGYEVSGNATQKAITSNFFNILTAGAGKTMDPQRMGGHSWATGGSNTGT